MQNLSIKAPQINATQIKFDGLYMAYIPLALMVSLIVASPVAWKRKIIASIGGILIVKLQTCLLYFK